MAIMKIHQHSSHVLNNPLMPDDVRDKYQREGMRGTLCGHVRPGNQVSDNSSDITCVLCLREQKKSQTHQVIRKLTNQEPLMKYDLSFFIWSQGQKLPMNADMTALNDETAVLVAKQIIAAHQAVGPIKLTRGSDGKEVSIA